MKPTKRRILEVSQKAARQITRQRKKNKVLRERNQNFMSCSLNAFWKIKQAIYFQLEGKRMQIMFGKLKIYQWLHLRCASHCKAVAESVVFTLQTRLRYLVQNNVLQTHYRLQKLLRTVNEETFPYPLCPAFIFQYREYNTEKAVPTSRQTEMGVPPPICHAWGNQLVDLMEEQTLAGDRKHMKSHNSKNGEAWIRISSVKHDHKSWIHGCPR